MGGRVRRRAWRTCDDYARGHNHGNVSRSGKSHERRKRARGPVTSNHSWSFVKTTSKTEVLQRIHDVGLIPVVRAESAEMARRAVAAVCEGGISIVEITMTVPGAIDVIRALAEGAGTGTLIGAGTVLDAQT